MSFDHIRRQLALLTERHSKGVMKPEQTVASGNEDQETGEAE